LWNFHGMCMASLYTKAFLLSAASQWMEMHQTLLTLSLPLTAMQSL
jgi:hypothetical protein